MNAKDYKKLASAKRVEAEVFDVTLPSGSVWKLREPPIQQFVLAGKLPASLAAKMAKAAQDGKNNPDGANQDLQDSLTPEDLLNNIAFGRDLLLFCAVEPKISLNPVHDDEIAPEDILPEDFGFLMSWVMTGGKSGESLNTFRSE